MAPSKTRRENCKHPSLGGLRCSLRGLLKTFQRLGDLAEQRQDGRAYNRDSPIQQQLVGINGGNARVEGLALPASWILGLSLGL